MPVPVRALDWLLVAVSAALVLAGPAMALQEWARHTERTGLADLTGEPQPLDIAFRAPWRSALLVGVIAAGIAGTILAVRIARQPRVRSVSGRLMWLLLGGMTLLDLAFLLDGRLMESEPIVRGSTTVWLYPIAGILMAGSALRLAEVEDAFAQPGGAK